MHGFKVSDNVVEVTLDHIPLAETSLTKSSSNVLFNKKGKLIPKTKTQSNTTLV
jgi:hypothetical protein